MGGIEGYVCVPDGHNETSGVLQSLWKSSPYIDNMYFVTATFSNEGKTYFPNHYNHYLFALYSDTENTKRDLSKHAFESMSFLFPTRESLFERPSMAKLNYISVYYLKQSYDQQNVRDLEDVFLRRRERLRAASMAEMQIIPDSSVKFLFPYSNELIVLELESEQSHQSDQKYCERTRKEVIRKGMDINNLVSFSVLSELK